VEDSTLCIAPLSPANVGVEKDINVLAKVLNLWNLGGEAMITFFNWAIK